jgi:hypothetical protein
MGALTMPAAAQVSGVAGVGTKVTTSVPRITGQVSGATATATRAGTNGAGVNSATNAGAHLSLGQIRQSVDAATGALLANISLTAEQQTKVNAYAKSYAKELKANAEAKGEASVATAGDAEQQAASQV